MWFDPIVEEIRAIRRKHTDKFRGDVRAICEDFRKRQRESNRKIVTFVDQVESAPIPLLQSTPAHPDLPTSPN
jgi:hypothetical protein